MNVQPVVVYHVNDEMVWWWYDDGMMMVWWWRWRWHWRWWWWWWWWWWWIVWSDLVWDGDVMSCDMLCHVICYVMWYVMSCDMLCHVICCTVIWYASTRRHHMMLATWPVQQPRREVSSKPPWAFTPWWSETHSFCILLHLRIPRNIDVHNIHHV